MNKFINNIKSPKTIALADKVSKLEREGKKIIKFQTGDPDFETHKEVLQTLKESIDRGETHYSNSQGLPELREAISNYKNKLYKVSIDPDEQILITIGGAQGVFLSLMALLNPLDEVVLFEPYYPQYEYIIKILGGIVKKIPPVFDIDSFTYRMNLDSLKKNVNNRTKAIIINSPNNPSGKIFSSDEIINIMEVVYNNSNAYLISDEVYSQIVDEDKKHASFLEFAQVFDRLIYINSFSKTYSMTGWRLGYIISQQEIIKKILKILQINTTCVPAFIQRAGVKAITSQEVQEHVRFMVNNFNKRRRKIYSLIKEHPLYEIYPDGAFYYLLKLPFLSSEAIDKWVFRLLEDEEVAVVSAYVYGDSFASFFRISFSLDDENVIEGMKRIISFYNKTV